MFVKVRVHGVSLWILKIGIDQLRRQQLIGLYHFAAGECLCQNCLLPWLGTRRTRGNGDFCHSVDFPAVRIANDGGVRSPSRRDSGSCF